VRKPRCAIVVAILLAVFVAGCGGGNEVETVEFKKTDIAPFEQMKEQMTKNLKGGYKAPKETPTK
jgi:hypothetical protein